VSKSLVFHKACVRAQMCQNTGPTSNSDDEIQWQWNPCIDWNKEDSGSRNTKGDATHPTMCRGSKSVVSAWSMGPSPGGDVLTTPSETGIEHPRYSPLFHALAKSAIISVLYLDVDVY
jgi:hypothetical protein